MKKLTACLALVGITLTLLYAVEPPPAPKLSKAAHWEAYEAALKKGLPKTAITHLDPIIEKTLADKDYAEAIKAHGLDGLGVILVRQSFLDNRVKMSDGGLGKAFF